MTSPRRFTLVLLVFLALLLAARHAHADRGQMQVTLSDGRTLNYWYIRPEGFDAAKAYPVVLALPPGPQTRPMVSAALNMFDPVARERGWVVISLEASDGRLFVREGGADIPALVSHLRSWCLVEGDKLFLAGASNGGVSAFRAALDEPTRYRAIAAYPGFAPEEDDYRHFDRLKTIPIRIFCGGDDTVAWHNATKRTQTTAAAAGCDATLEFLPTEGHVMRSISGAKILDMFQPMREPAKTPNPDAAAIALVLDTLHDAASKAEERRYFDLYAPEGVFIGTDAGERWNLEEFRAYARPLFSKGKGWTYKLRPGSRHIDLVPSAGAEKSPSVAWFDELLDNEKYGLCRGSGVLRKIDGQWKIAQYHLTVPVPNDLLERVAKLIAAEAKKPKPKGK